MKLHEDILKRRIAHHMVFTDSPSKNIGDIIQFGTSHLADQCARDIFRKMVKVENLTASDVWRLSIECFVLTPADLHYIFEEGFKTGRNRNYPSIHLEV